MGKVAIRIVGSLFLLWGLWYIVDFLWTGHQPSAFIGIDILGHDVGGFVFVLILLMTGLGIIALKNSGRIWGLIILWIYFLPNFAFSILCFVLAINPGLDFPIRPGRISFKGTEYGLGQDYAITNPWIVLTFSVFITIYIGMQIYILSSKKNRAYFIVENNTGS